MVTPRHWGYTTYRCRTFASRAWFVFASIAGVLLTVITAYAEFVDPLVHPRAVLGSVIVGSVAGGIVVGWVAVRQLSELSVSIHPGLEVRVVVGDFMENLEKFDEAACVFGVNDTFDVSGLKPGSIHAQFLDRYFPDQDEATRQSAMDQALARCVVKVLAPMDAGSPESEERTRFEHGTVACLEFADRPDGEERHALLLANSRRERHDFSGHKLTAGSVRRVWDYLEDARLRPERVVFALIGTGNSGDLSPMGSVFHVLEEYFRHIEQQGFNGARVRNLVLSVRPQVVQDGSVDLAVVHAYLKARARFSAGIV